jgi:hypothetical protein
MHNGNLLFDIISKYNPTSTILCKKFIANLENNQLHWGMAIAWKRFVNKTPSTYAGVGKRGVSILERRLCIRVIRHEKFNARVFLFLTRLNYIFIEAPTDDVLSKIITYRPYLPPGQSICNKGQCLPLKGCAA